MSASAPLLDVTAIETFYGPIQAIRGVSLQVAQGQIVTVLGANGAGKTTVLRTISGVLDAERGAVRFEGKDINHLPPDRVMRLGICHVPEDLAAFGHVAQAELDDLGRIGTVLEVGSATTSVSPGDKVLVSGITTCGRCSYCRKRMFSQCRNGGWMLGNTLHGTQAELLRAPFADNTLRIGRLDRETAIRLLSNLLPTAPDTGETQQDAGARAHGKFPPLGPCHLPWLRS